MLFVLVQNRDIADVINSPINADTNKALVLYIGKNVFMLAFFAANKRSTNLDLRALRSGKYLLDYL